MATVEQDIAAIMAEHDPDKAEVSDGYWYCPCGYDYGVFAPDVVSTDEGEFAHVADVVADFVRKKQVKAWDKGFGKGVKIHHWWQLSKGVSNKENKNPYLG